MATLQTLGLPDTRTPTQNSPPLKTSHTHADTCIYYRSTLIPTAPTYLQIPRLFPLCFQRFYRGRFLREHTALCARGNTGTGHTALHSRGRLLRAYRSVCPWKHGHWAYRPPFPWPVTRSIPLCVPVEARALGTPPSTPGVVTSVHVELHVKHLRPCSCPSCVRTSRQEPRNPGHSCDDQHAPKICDDLQP